MCPRALTVLIPPSPAPELRVSGSEDRPRASERPGPRRSQWLAVSGEAWRSSGSVRLKLGEEPEGSPARPGGPLPETCLLRIQRAASRCPTSRQLALAKPSSTKGRFTVSGGGGVS